MSAKVNGSYLFTKNDNELVYTGLETLFGRWK